MPLTWCLGHVQPKKLRHVSVYELSSESWAHFLKTSFFLFHQQQTSVKYSSSSFLLIGIFTLGHSVLVLYFFSQCMLTAEKWNPHFSANTCNTYNVQNFPIDSHANVQYATKVSGSIKSSPCRHLRIAEASGYRISFVATLTDRCADTKLEQVGVTELDLFTVSLQFVPFGAFKMRFLADIRPCSVGQTIQNAYAPVWWTISLFK